jgi:hypothetical protein
MPRQVRIEYEGAICHLMSRGNSRQDLRRRRRPEEVFENLGKGCGMTGWEVLKCLLDLDVDRMLTPIISKDPCPDSLKRE